jgi:hypothetical protein
VLTAVAKEVAGRARQTFLSCAFELRRPTIHMHVFSLEIHELIHHLSFARLFDIVAPISPPSTRETSDRDHGVRPTRRKGGAPGLHRAHKILQCASTTSTSAEAPRDPRDRSVWRTLHECCLCFATSKRAAIEHRGGRRTRNANRSCWHTWCLRWRRARSVRMSPRTSIQTDKA